jgi:hypothetical protein
MLRRVRNLYIYLYNPVLFESDLKHLVLGPMAALFCGTSPSSFSGSEIHITTLP